MARKSETPEMLSLAKEIALMNDKDRESAILSYVGDKDALKIKVASERAHIKRIKIDKMIDGFVPAIKAEPDADKREELIFSAADAVTLFAYSDKRDGFVSDIRNALAPKAPRARSVAPSHTAPEVINAALAIKGSPIKDRAGARAAYSAFKSSAFMADLDEVIFKLDIKMA